MIGSRTKAYGIGQSRLKKKVSESDPHRACQKYIPLHSEILEIKVKKMIEELGSEDYIVK